MTSIRSWGSCAVRGTTEYLREAKLHSNIGFSSILTVFARRLPINVSIEQFMEEKISKMGIQNGKT